MHDLRSLARTVPRSALGVAALLMACQDGGPLEPDPLMLEGDGPLATVSQAAVPVPYRGTLVTTAQTPGPPPPGCEMFLLTAQEGTATHLGEYTGTGTTCAFNGQPGVPESPIDPQGAPPPYFVTEFTVEQTHTAANGDLLEISGGGILVQSLTDGTRVFVGNGTIVGGTGRFAGATGAFAIWAARGEDPRFDGWMMF